MRGKRSNDRPDMKTGASKPGIHSGGGGYPLLLSGLSCEV